jgi:hypothetical protein
MIRSTMATSGWSVQSSMHDDKTGPMDSRCPGRKAGVRLCSAGGAGGNMAVEQRRINNAARTATSTAGTAALKSRMIKSGGATPRRTGAVEIRCTSWTSPCFLFEPERAHWRNGCRTKRRNHGGAEGTDRERGGSRTKRERIPERDAIELSR